MKHLKLLGILALATVAGCSTARRQQAQLPTSPVTNQKLHASVETDLSSQDTEYGGTLREVSREETAEIDSGSEEFLASLPGTSIGEMPAPALQPRLRLQRSFSSG